MWRAATPHLLLSYTDAFFPCYKLTPTNNLQADLTAIFPPFTTVLNVQIPLSPFCPHLRARTRLLSSDMVTSSLVTRHGGNRATEAAGWTGKTSPWQQLITPVTFAFINGRLLVRAFQAVYQEIPVHHARKLKLLCLLTSSIGKTVKRISSNYWTRSEALYSSTVYIFVSTSYPYQSASRASARGSRKQPPLFSTQIQNSKGADYSWPYMAVWGCCSNRSKPPRSHSKWQPSSKAKPLN